MRHWWLPAKKWMCMFPSLSAAFSDSPFTLKLVEDILKRLHHLNTHFLPPPIQLDASTLKEVLWHRGRNKVHLRSAEQTSPGWRSAPEGS